MRAVNEIGEPLRQVLVIAVPKGCRGAACPLFAQCQGRCASPEAVQRSHPDGGVWIEVRA